GLHGPRARRLRRWRVPAGESDRRRAVGARVGPRRSAAGRRGGGTADERGNGGRRFGGRLRSLRRRRGVGALGWAKGGARRLRAQRETEPAVGVAIASEELSRFVSAGADRDRGDGGAE